MKTDYSQTRHAIHARKFYNSMNEEQKLEYNAYRSDRKKLIELGFGEALKEMDKEFRESMELFEEAEV